MDDWTNQWSTEWTNGPMKNVIGRGRPCAARWHTISETPTKKYDLIQGINARGAFIMTRECLPHMRRKGWGRVAGARCKLAKLV